MCQNYILLTLSSIHPLTTAKEEGSESILPEKRQGTLPVSVSRIKSNVLSGSIICRSLGFNHLTVTLMIGVCLDGGPMGEGLTVTLIGRGVGPNQSM